MQYYATLLITFVSLHNAVIVAMEDNKMLFRHNVDTAVSLFKLERNEDQEEQLNQLLHKIFAGQDLELEEQQWAEEQLLPFLVTKKDLKKFEDDCKKQFEEQQAQIKEKFEKLKKQTVRQNFKIKLDFSEFSPSFMEQLKKENDESSKEFMEKLQHQQSTSQKHVKRNIDDEISHFATKTQLKKAEAELYEKMQKMEQMQESINHEIEKLSKSLADSNAWNQSLLLPVLYLKNNIEIAHQHLQK